MIDVEQRALRALEQHAPRRLDRAMDHQADVLRERQQPLREPLEQLERLHRRQRACPSRSARAARCACSAPLLHELAQPLGMSQIEHAHAAPRDLVLVRRPDAAPRRADRLARGARAVHQLVIRQHEVRALAHVQPAFDVDSRRRRARRSPSNSVSGSSTTPLPIAQRTPGCRMPLGIWCSTKRRVAEVDRVAGVRAALVAHDPVGALGEHVDELSLPFVAPLGADDDDDALTPDRTCCSRTGAGRNKKRPAGAGRWFNLRPDRVKSIIQTIAANSIHAAIASRSPPSSPPPPAADQRARRHARRRSAACSAVSSRHERPDERAGERADHRADDRHRARR